jgi:hypothetical protein
MTLTLENTDLKKQISDLNLALATMMGV